VELLKKINFAALMIITFMLAACGQKGDIALKVTGSVVNEMGWTEDQVKKMNTLDVNAANKDGEIKNYSGVLIVNLLDKAGLNANASSLVFVGDDGNTGKVSIEDVQACSDCIVSFRNQGGFSIVMPGFPGKVQIKEVVEIQVK
jgi:hypothetical protein